MKQAITTKYFAPTNTKGSRIKAECAAKTIYVSWDYELDSDQNHEIAAATLVEKLGWKTDYLFGGGMKAHGQYCFVLVSKSEVKS